MLRRVTAVGLWLGVLALACAGIALALAALLGRAGERRRGDAFVPSAFGQAYRDPAWRYGSPSPSSPK